MAILICAATVKELTSLAHGRLKEDICEMEPAMRSLKNGPAIFLATGVGPINAALALGKCLGIFNACHNLPENAAQPCSNYSENSLPKITSVLFAGIAGAFDLQKTPLCSIWRVQEEIWPEYGLNDGSTVTARAFSYPLWQKPDGTSVYERIKLDDIGALDIRENAKTDKWGICKSLTVAGVTASFIRHNFLFNAFHAELENMEGFAAAYAALRAGLPFIEIRSVSNKTGPRKKDEKDFAGAIKALEEILPSLGIV